MLYLTEAGEAGLAKFRGKGSDSVWKDTYIFISVHLAELPDHEQPDTTYEAVLRLLLELPD